MNNPAPLPTSPTTAPGRAEIVNWLAGLGERSGELERIDSMELAWLVHQVEQHYALELADEYLDRIKTIDSAVAVIAEALSAAGVLPPSPALAVAPELEPDRGTHA
ncbi:acyl carrier protein [Kribbella qitaiheensis]|uniref:acyl carrier protein n=1 Tax=Kribbella qitaiheensis TaxID=1544730 RepID=UPI0019D5E8F4|nr:acyl carrier protein [Kribbella qitaiheensis]